MLNEFPIITREQREASLKQLRAEVAAREKERRVRLANQKAAGNGASVEKTHQLRPLHQERNDVHERARKILDNTSPGYSKARDLSIIFGIGRGVGFGTTESFKTISSNIKANSDQVKNVLKLSKEKAITKQFWNKDQFKKFDLLRLVIAQVLNSELRYEEVLELRKGNNLTNFVLAIKGGKKYCPEA